MLIKKRRQASNTKETITTTSLVANNKCQQVLLLPESCKMADGNICVQHTNNIMNKMANLKISNEQHLKQQQQQEGIITKAIDALQATTQATLSTSAAFMLPTTKMTNTTTTNAEATTLLKTQRNQSHLPTNQRETKANLDDNTNKLPTTQQQQQHAILATTACQQRVNCNKNKQPTTTTSKSLKTTRQLPTNAFTTTNASQKIAKTTTTSITSSITSPKTTTTTATTAALARTCGIWLLPLLCLTALFSCGHAGFACLSNPCVFGVCIDGLNSSYSCYCIDGYTGIQCQTNWDECWSGPCQNGGTCVDGVAYYNCTCPDGFSGSNCEENVDECMSNPCQNGGHCRDRNNGYSCTCQPGYLGLNCETDVAVCETGTGARCQNGGECIEGPGLEFSCECTIGWKGRICQEEINECESAPCQNGGVCVDKLASYVCACPMGYTGTNCEEEILICADNPCQNNALCLMEEGVPTCYCVPDYHGEKCEYQYDECQLGPRCMNGGVCIDGVDTFSCSCPPLLTGMLCECLMIGEDSLDCNYTAPSTRAPPVLKLPTTSAPTTTRAPEVITDTITSAEGLGTSASTEESGEDKTHENGVSGGVSSSTSAEAGTTPSTSDAAGSDESGNGYTTEAGGVSYSVGSSESSYSHTVSGSAEVSSSDEYTTIPRVSPIDSGSREPTTAKTTTGISDESVYTIISHSAETPTSASGSDEQPVITYTPRPTYTYHVTTVETTFSFDYTTPKSSWGSPTYHPTVTILPGSTTKTVETGTSAALPPTEYTDYTEHEGGGGGGGIGSTHRPIWKDISTTAAPFFTEFPEVFSTTRYHDLTGKDLTVTGIELATTTHEPPMSPSISATTSAGFDYESAAPTTDHNTFVYQPNLTTTMPPTYHTVQATTHAPTEHPPHVQHTTVGPATTEQPEPSHSTIHPHHHPHHHHHQYSTLPTTVDIVTMPPLSTDDLVSVAVPSTEASLPAFPTTTERKPSITYIPPTQPHVYTPATYPPTTIQTPTPTLPPHPDTPIYSTHVPMITRPALPTSPTAIGSAEDTEGFNTVPTGKGTDFGISPISPIGPVSPGPPSGPPIVGVDNVTSDVDCIKTGCYNGGTCVTTSEGTKCVCRFDRQGALCETQIIVKNAAFSGDSYVSHRIHKDLANIDSLDTVLPMHVQLKVRTRATNGLIMLAAAQGTKGGHYMALFLQKGLLQFQFSCGLQTMLLSELETPVNTGNEITIRAELDFSRNYTHCNASLLVNDTLAMSGDQPTWLKLLPARLHTPEAILNTWLHLGGAPQAPIGLIIELPPAQSGTGFTGCLHSLRINEQPREIFGDAMDGFGITECGSLACLSSPCRNGAACIKIESNEIDENGDKVEKWKCKCPTGYMGPTCEVSVCEDNPCQYGGTCVQFPGSGYLCLCPLGKHGHYCEHNLEVALPSFSGSVNGLSSFVAYTVPIPLEYSIELSFKILPQTMSQISLLAFIGQSGFHDENSDHLAISFIQGYIMLTWNLGAGPRRIFTQKPIDFRLDAPRVPYEIKVGRIGRQAWLSVDGKFNITGRSPGTVSRMDVVPILYLGGHEIANFNTLPHDLPLHSGFQGCIYDVHLRAGQVTVPLQETRGVRGRGVGQCGTRECHRHACQHDGACLQHGATFTCICQEGWYGPLCAQPTNPCDSFNNKCADDATCVPLVNGYECDCPVGKTGKNCEEEIRSLSDVSLTGRRSYLAVRWPYLYDNSDKLGSKRSQMVSYRNFTKKLMPPKPVSSPSQHFVMKLLNEVEKQRNFSPVPLMGSKSFDDVHRVQFFFIEFQLRPLSERGLLLYFGTLNNNQDKKVGFVSLSLQGGVVEFRISGPSNHVTVVRSVRMLAIGEWHKIKMAQRGRWLTLWVEGSASSALAPSAEVLVEPEALLYIGGLKDLSKLPHNAISGFPIPFRGCVRGLVVSGTRIILNESNILESRNIRDCDGTACGGDSCEAGGHCWLDEKLQPHCICPEYAKGDRCEYSETCKLIPCKNNGRCLRSGRCSCPNGWGGFYCEIAMSKPTTPSFRGNSYLILPPPRIPMKDKRKGPSMYIRPREAIQISLNFSTIEPDGLLLWSEHDRVKFLGLGLENGHLKIASNLLGSNNDTVAAAASGYIADGAWHLAQVILDRTRLELQLDNEVIFTERLGEATTTTTTSTTTTTTGTTSTTLSAANSHAFKTGTSTAKIKGTRTSALPSLSALAIRRGKEPSITYEDIFYLGGFPKMDSVSARTQGRFNEPFKGCLQDIQFGAEPNTVITDFSGYQGENIGSCDLHGDELMVL